MKQQRFIVLILVGLLFWTDVPAAWIFSAGKTLHILGIVEVGDYSKFSKALNSNVDRISINSPGGNLNEGILIAKKISTSGVHVEVVRYCVSTCASTIFVAARTRTIRADAFVAFHGGEFGLARNFVRAVRVARDNTGRYSDAIARVGEDLSIDFNKQHAALRSLQWSGHAGWDWLDYVFDFTSQPVERIAVSEPEGRLSPILTGQPICQYWVPDRESLAEIGIRLSDEWTLDRSKVQQQLKTEPDRIYWGSLRTLQASPDAPCR